MSNDRDLLISEVENLIITIDEIDLPTNAHSKYLLNHLRYYLEKIRVGNDKDLRSAADKFGMYCTEHMDWDTDEYKTCIKLIELGRKIAKKESLK